MPSLLPLPKQDVILVDGQSYVPSARWYDWFVRLQRVLGTASTSAALTVSAVTGTITTASATLNYKQIGRIVFYDISATITTNGTGAGAVLLTGLPFRPLRNSAIYGRENLNTGKGLTGRNSASSDEIKIVYYDNTYPGADGNVLLISGFCEVA